MNALLLQRELVAQQQHRQQQEESETTSSSTTVPIKKILVDSQLELNHLVHKLMTTSSSSSSSSEQQQQCLHIQVIQKRDRPHLSITGLLKAFLLTNHQHQLLLHTLSLPNVSIGADEAKLLASLLLKQSPASPLRSLQLGQLEVTAGASILLAAVASSKTLHELHLRLRVVVTTASNNNFNNVGISQALCRALQQNSSLQRVSLSGFALLGDRPTQRLLARTVQANPQWTELRLHACNYASPLGQPHGRVDAWNNHHHHHAATVVVTDVQALAHSVATHPNLQRVDILHNDLCDPRALPTLLQSSSIAHLSLSQNLLGYDCGDSTESRRLQQQLHDALRRNTVLRELWLDGNPVSEALAQNVLLQALQYANTTLRACVVRPNHHRNHSDTASAETIEQIRHCATLNAAGRGEWRRLLDTNTDNKNNSNNGSRMGALMADQPSVDTTYGLLREDPGRWVRQLKLAPAENRHHTDDDSNS